TEPNNPAYLDFMARRLVEMAGYIIMAYLMLQDAKVNESFRASALVYTKMVQAEVARHCEFINNFDIAQLDAYTFEA
ncbi:MAG: acyl-CoA dehydrogenase, partial [Muribaculaceae bacterium]|nr:acyl-CoA dehydrogenase [Muribaculaceae bacterium]